VISASYGRSPSGQKDAVPALSFPDGLACAGTAELPQVEDSVYDHLTAHERKCLAGSPILDLAATGQVPAYGTEAQQTPDFQ
jgi:hypothetical protein